MKDGEKMNDFLKDGKGRYIGETSRSIYERSKEHQRDKENQEDDSHQIKHWRLDHPELPEPPEFKFSLIASFQDPLSRQLAESVRIERGGIRSSTAARNIPYVGSPD